MIRLVASDSGIGVIPGMQKSFKIEGIYSSSGQQQGFDQGHMIGETYYYRANAKMKLGDLDGAMQDFCSSLEMVPDNAAVYCGLGVLKSKIGDHEGAFKDLERSIELDPHNPYAYHHMGIAREELGDTRGARKCHEIADRLIQGSDNEY